jgi:CDP-alcohol phosphatidyltransferase
MLSLILHPSRFCCHHNMIRRICTRRTTLQLLKTNIYAVNIGAHLRTNLGWNCARSYSQLPKSKQIQAAITKRTEQTKLQLRTNINKIKDATNNIKNVTNKISQKLKLKLERPVKRENIYTIPNLLTVGRIVLAPIIGYHIMALNFYTASALLVVGGFTDFLDGYIARKYNQKTYLGTLYLC